LRSLDAAIASSLPMWRSSCLCIVVIQSWRTTGPDATGGSRVGVETIAEYLQGRSGLHFTLGLVELSIYQLADGARIVVPRVLAKSQTLVRSVIEVPEGSCCYGLGSAFGTFRTLVEAPLSNGMQSLVQGNARAHARHATTGLGGFQAEKRGAIGAERALSEAQRTLLRECLRRNWHKNSGT
jgi:hypothetical protein